MMNKRTILFTSLGLLFLPSLALAQEAEAPTAAPEAKVDSPVDVPSKEGQPENASDEIDNAAGSGEGDSGFTKAPPAEDTTAEDSGLEDSGAESGQKHGASSQDAEVSGDVSLIGAAGDKESAPPALDTQGREAVPELRGASRPSQRNTIGLSPSAPQGTAITGGVTPSFGEPSRSSSDWSFDVNGFLLLPLRIGINERENAQGGQKTTVLHTPPVVPGDLETFEYTSVAPDPWAQLNFSYGNKDVTATVILAARAVSNANGYYDPSDQLGINDAFITFHPEGTEKAQYNVHVGAFANRYGIMGEYDMGQYGTPLIARLGGMGATGTGHFKLGSMDLAAELGVLGQLNKAPVGVEPAGWNGFTDPNAGTSFAGHAHLAAGLNRNVSIGLHGIHSLSQDDRATTTTQKDGTISVLGADLRLTMQRFGHFYLGYGFTNAKTARSVSGIIRVLNSAGGLGLMDQYFGLESEGTGQLHTLGVQYDFSLGNALHYPKPFNGKGPDLVLGGFGIATAVSTPVTELDGVFKLKYGATATYSMLSWFGAGIRYDRVLPNTKDASQTHAIVSPRLIFKSGWASRDQVVLQYSGYLYGSNSVARVGYPPAPDPTVKPDAHVVSLIGSMWW